MIDYSKDRGEKESSTFEQEGGVFWRSKKIILVMKLIICWSTSHYQKNRFLILERWMSNVLEMLTQFL